MNKWRPLLIIVGIVAVIALMFGGKYNKLVAGEEGVKSAWAQVENVYQRRADLIPNLVETVKGAAKFEQDTLKAVVEARAKATQTNINPGNAQQFAQFQQSQGELSSALSRLMVVVERYPELKANQNYLALQTQLEGTENRIAVERMRYNEVAQSFNTMRRTFPNNVFAKILGFGEKFYFQADSGAEKAPAVKF